MNALSEKVFLTLAPPTEEDARSDQRRLLDALREDFGEVALPLPLVRRLYPLCRKAEWRVTATLVWTGKSWQVMDLEPGDTTAWHYGLAADLGSTSVTMELVDLRSGTVVARESMYNRQTALGSDVLTRIFYAKDQPEHLEELRLAALETLNELMGHLTEISGVEVRRCPGAGAGGKYCDDPLSSGAGRLPAVPLSLRAGGGGARVPYRSGAGAGHGGAGVPVSGSGQLHGRRYHQRPGSHRHRPV